MIFNCITPIMNSYEEEPEERHKYFEEKYIRLTVPTDRSIKEYGSCPVCDNTKNPIIDRDRIESNPLGQFFQVKRHSLLRSFYDITGLIEERKKLKDQNLYQIALGECEVLTRMHRLDDWLEGLNPGVDKRRSGLEKDLLDFGRQKRSEEVATWKDVLLLKKDLRELVNEMYKEHSKQSLVYKVK